MPKYNLDAKYILQNDLLKLDDELVEKLWKLFIKIGEFWENVDDPLPMKSNFLVFISNRIEINYNYLHEYVSAVAVIDELVAELGETEGYKKLFTDPTANLAPPNSRIARARQLVSNEFITLQLSLGGFKNFGSTINYPGYFGGANIVNETPYRTYKSNK